jgi:hypothetical protein
LFYRSIVDRVVFSIFGVNHFQFCFGRTGSFEGSYTKFPSVPKLAYEDEGVELADAFWVLDKLWKLWFPFHIFCFIALR